MPRRNPQEYIRTPQEEALHAARHAKAEARIQRERAEPAVNHLVKARHCGIVALEGSNPSYIMGGIIGIIGENRMLKMPSRGNIQGEEKDVVEAEKVLAAISHHRREFGRNGVIAFTNFDYDDTSRGTPRITDRIVDFLEDANPPIEDTNPSILLIGYGREEHLTGNGCNLAKTKLQPVGGLVLARLGLKNDNELSSAPSFDYRYHTAPKLDEKELRAVGIDMVSLPMPQTV